MKDNMVVQGGVAEFGDKEPDSAEAAPQSASQEDIRSSDRPGDLDLENVIGNYVQLLADFDTRGEYSFNPIDFNTLGPFICALRFDEDLCLVADQVKKDVFLDRLKSQNPDSAYLIEHTDLGDVLPDPIYFGGSLGSVPEGLSLLGLDTVRTDAQLAALRSRSGFAFLMQSYEVVSLFIRDGALFRQYAEFMDNASGASKPSGVTFDMTNSTHGRLSGIIKLWNDPLRWNFVDPKSMRALVEKTGNRNISDMFQDLQHLKAECCQVRRDFVGMKKLFYERLNNYNPGLVYQKR